ncbi:MAG TPA: glutathione S-transferase family protein [Burkholderiales bacterium]|nr:glutathione S-transferase family protein [Burkholderiales bacterium]
MLLVIGNYNYSSWSLRAWLGLKASGFEFDTVRIPLYGPGARQQILKHSPAGKVPILKDGDTLVWDSLAILEYLAEKNPKLWPADPAERARARSVSAEMHAGFANLRTHMSMNVRKCYPGKGRTPEVLSEIRRIDEIWSQAEGPFLFGRFSAADAMYAPVVLRFRTYDVQVSNRAYAEAMLALPAMQEWIAAAEREAESIPQFDMYE